MRHADPFLGTDYSITAVAGRKIFCDLAGKLGGFASCPKWREPIRSTGLSLSTASAPNCLIGRARSRPIVHFVWRFAGGRSPIGFVRLIHPHLSELEHV
jgi:hypothetical protein